MYCGRKYRISQEVRDKYADIILNKNDFIQPYFVVSGSNIKEPIDNFYNVYHYSIDCLLKELEDLLKTGVNKILLFGIIPDSEKDAVGTAGWQKNNLIANTIYKVKTEFPSLTIISDVCLCGYTNHGHCGIVSGKTIDNDKTLPYLSDIALSHAQANVDIVAPSAMMDGQVQAIRKKLDANNYDKVKIMSYSVKYASYLYGPFRAAVDSAPVFGDRKTYQMDFRNINQAIDETRSDINEGADIVMIKPAHTYLDIITRIKNVIENVPIAAYQVSGEYMMLKLLSEKRLIDERQAFYEILTAIKRAGTDLIISYYSKELFKWIN